MPFLRRLRPVDDRQQNATRDRERLPGVLHEIAQQFASGTAEVQLQLQPVIQFSGASTYPAWARGWQTAWSGAGVDQTRIEWPDKLPIDHTAALLIPVLPGRIGLAIGRHPSPQVPPLLAQAHLPATVEAADMALNVLLTWLGTRPPTAAVELAPPVLEFTRSGRVHRREIQTYGQHWPLRPADGI